MMIWKAPWRALLLALAILPLFGCAVGSPPPVVDLYGQDTHSGRVERGTHRVQPGETLYSIAWRYGWDYRDLARINDIAPPYTIYPGETLHFGAPGSTVSASRVPVSEGVAGTPVTPPVQPEPVATDAGPTPEPAPTSEPEPAPTISTPLHWQWPAEGALASTFGDGGAAGRGIAIRGRLGSPVRAAAAGQVVYRGSGLTGYGKMIIIKHNERWLSAYAHNQTLLVDEGQRVKAGEQIATMGASGTYRTQLHFEIRRDGKPVNPLSVLPDR